MYEGCARRPDCPLSFGGHRGCGVDGAAKGAAPPPVANLPYHMQPQVSIIAKTEGWFPSYINKQLSYYHIYNTS